MLNFFAFFVLFNVMKTEKKIKFKISTVTFLKGFLPLKNFWRTSGFRAIDDLPLAQCDETDFSLI